MRTRDIAFEEALAEKFLEPILLEQKNARMLESVRGAKGGYKLRRPPSEIYLGRNHSTDRRHWSPFADRAQLRDRIENDVDRQALFLVFLDVRDWGGEDSRNTSLADLIKQDKPRGAKSQRTRKESAAKVLPITLHGKRAQEEAMKFKAVVVISFLLCVISQGFGQTVLRVGAFPNITHAQAMVGKATGWFEKAMGPNVKIAWRTFNAGPSAIEALYAGAIDMTYIGPNPTISGYVRSQGEALKVVAGAASGGASLVVRSNAGINKPEDFHGKRVASPQLGNTQDVALRAWLKSHGMTPTDKGGDVKVLPLANPDQLTLFQKQELDAAWTPEPWATRLIREGHGRRFLDERDLWPDHQFIVTNLIVSAKFLREHPDLIKNWVRANVELTDWIRGHVPEAKQLLNVQIQKETGKALPAALMDEAYGHFEVTYDPIRSSLLTCARSAYEAGFLGRQMPDLSGLYDLSFLNQVLAEKGRKAVQ